MPVDAVPDSVIMTFVYAKGGANVEFTADKFPDDFSDSLYKFVNRYDNVVRKGKNNEPPIKGFSITGVSGTDSTEIILSMPYSILLFEEKPAASGAGWEKDFLKIQKTAAQKNVPLFIVTTSLEEFSKKRTTNLPVMICDYTSIRTAARANPTIYLLKNGTVQGKWSYANFDNADKVINNLK
jgi:hypothetical protein